MSSLLNGGLTRKERKARRPGKPDPRAFGLQELSGGETDAGRAASDEDGLVFHDECVVEMERTF